MRGLTHLTIQRDSVKACLQIKLLTSACRLWLESGLVQAAASPWKNVISERNACVRFSQNAH